MNLDDRTMVRIALLMPNGVVVMRDWSYADIRDGDNGPPINDPPKWLLDSHKSWPHPQDPITFSGRVDAGRESDAWALIGEGL